MNPNIPTPRLLIKMTKVNDIHWFLSGKESTMQDILGSIPGSERYPGERNGKPTPVLLLENPMERETRKAIQFMGSQKSQT